MKKRFRYIYFLIILFLFSASLTTDNSKILLNVLIHSLNTLHYQPLILNDEFSKKVFELYLKRFDYNKKFLTASDVNELRKYQYKIDDELKKGSHEFFDLSTEIINKRNNEVEIYYKDLLSRPFDFEKNEDIEFDVEKINYANGKEELKEYWRLSLKYQTLAKLANMLQVQEKAIESGDTTVEIKTFEKLEEEARKKVLKNHNDLFKRTSKIEKADRLTVYINSITNIYDPNTAYLPPKDKENFDIALSGRLEGIGAQLQERNGYIKVFRIIPGSASWRQGQLKAADIILKVGQGSHDPVNIVEMRIDDAVKLIRGKKGTEVRLTVKKLDGRILVIPIIRDVVILEETFAKSAIVHRSEISANGDLGHIQTKVGYIRLPKFYADLNKTGGRNCAEDIKKELIKLKQENVDGIILDLRSNSGGSLVDAVKMVGLFIEKGPIVQIKSRTGEPYTFKDLDHKIYYEGLLIIMVNFFSASASEIFAAAIQDYERGIIIGSSSTFGKGTVQRLYNLDNYLPKAFNDMKPLGTLKLTTQKYYRINGGATQIKGVIPDIILPDIYKYFDINAGELEYALPWDEISPVQFDLWKPDTKQSNDINQLKKMSKSRVKKNLTFKLIVQNTERLKKRLKNTTYSLNLVTYRNELKKINNKAKKYYNIQKEIPELTIKSLKSDISSIQSDSSKIERTKSWHKGLKKDVYLLEAISVLEDMMITNSK